MTREREVVLEAFLRLERHVTTEELLAEAKRIDPEIGQATVFRNIKILAEAGLARKACQDDGASSYEHAFKHPHHDHLICLGCGKIVEFRDEAIERAQDGVFERHGFLPAEHRLELRGYCPKCAKKRGAK
jgi:Fur family transcriptional regulator, ferric uptake regulator